MGVSAPLQVLFRFILLKKFVDMQPFHPFFLPGGPLVAFAAF
jgi:hypothetical protein